MFEVIWRSLTPSNVVAFSCIILLELISTSTHLFLFCNLVDKVLTKGDEMDGFHLLVG